jgi:Tfp pilus assembly protein PilP
MNRLLNVAFAILAPMTVMANTAAPPVHNGNVPAEVKTVEQYLDSLSSLPSASSHRDPFIKQPSPFEGMPRPPSPLPDIPASQLTDLERHSLDKYTILAVMLGDIYSRALVKMPDTRVMIVRERDKIGNKHGIIVGIKSNGVLVREAVVNDDNQIVYSEAFMPIGGNKEKDDAGKKPSQ